MKRMKGTLLILFAIGLTLGVKASPTGLEYVFRMRIDQLFVGIPQRISFNATVHVQKFIDDKLIVHIKRSELSLDGDPESCPIWQVLANSNLEQRTIPFLVHLKNETMREFFVGADEKVGVINIKRLVLFYLGLGRQNTVKGITFENSLYGFCPITLASDIVRPTRIEELEDRWMDEEVKAGQAPSINGRNVCRPTIQKSKAYAEFVKGVHSNECKIAPAAMELSSPYLEFQMYRCGHLKSNSQFIYKDSLLRKLVVDKVKNGIRTTVGNVELIEVKEYNAATKMKLPSPAKSEVSLIFEVPSNNVLGGHESKLSIPSSVDQTDRVMRPDILIDTTFSQHRNLFNIYKPKIDQLLRSTVPSRGKEFPNITGPKSKDKVCIVGAGPAGLHMALSLKDNGYQKIRIFEKTDRHGGKSYDTMIDGLYRPQGSIYLTADYVDNVFKLARRYDAGDMQSIDQPGMWVRNNASDISNRNKLTSTEFLFQQIANITQNTDPTYNIEQFLNATINYAELHYELFGKYKGMLMQEPTQKVYEKISGSFESFLERNNLKVIVPLLQRTNAAQGYGYVNEIGALYGLMWNTPQLLLSFGLQTLKINQYPYETYILKKGFENIWNKIVEKEHFDIKYNVDISLVLRDSRNHVTLLYKDQYQNRLSEDCDFLVWTPPMPELMNVLSNPTLEERKLFNTLSYHIFVSTIIRDTGTVRNRPYVIYQQSLEDGKNNVTDGEVIAELDVNGELNYCDANDDGSLPGGCQNTKIEYDKERTSRILTCLELRRNKTTEAMHRETVRKHYVDGFHATDIQFIHTKEWEYFYKWSPEELEKGNHWKVFNIQGKHGIWYAGASVSFESVKDVMEYNNLLIRQSKQEDECKDSLGCGWVPKRLCSISWMKKRCPMKCGLCTPKVMGSDTCPLGDPYEILSLEKENCITADDDARERNLFDLSHDCSEFGSHCQCKRDAAKNLTSTYYKVAEEEKSKKHKWKGELLNPPLCYGISAEDPRPNGIDRYIDYKNERTTPNKPSHGYYGKLPTNEVRDPTCNELRNALQGMCGHGDQPLGDWGRKGITLGSLCGMGTTWHPDVQKCIRNPDEYITIDGRGQPYAQRVYPTLRIPGSKSIFDEPNDNYIYLDENERNGLQLAPQNGQRCIPSFPGGSCTSDRCRFPLTSREGQHQAMLYVRLFRMVYEYQGPDRTESDRRKMILRTKIRQLIDNHAIWFQRGIHSNGDFLPWHRWYVLEMETILMEGQELYQLGSECNERFHGIPYFDWHNLKNNQSPKEFINDANDELGHDFHESLGQNTNPSRGCIREGALAGFQMTTGECLSRDWRDISAEDRPEDDLHPRFQSPTQYDQFRRWLEFERGLHGSVHNFIGGAMGTSRSSNDPIFFTHHCNVDKIWGDWQKQSSDHKNAFSGFRTTPRNSLLPASTATPAEMLDLDNLIYTPQDGAKQRISVSYVDFDTSSVWGDGNTSSIRL